MTGIHYLGHQFCPQWLFIDNDVLQFQYILEYYYQWSSIAITFFQFQQDADNTKLYAIVKRTMMYYNFNLSLTSNNTVKWSNIWQSMYFFK